MNIATTITTIIGFIFSALEVILSIAILALPLIMMKKPARQTRKFLGLLAIVAAALLIFSSFIGLISQISILVSIGVDASTVINSIFSCALGIFGITLTLVFPIVANLMKKDRPLLGILLVIPVIQSIIVIVNSASGMSFIVAADLPANVPGIFCGLLLALVLILAAVWYLTGLNRTLSLAIAIAAPVVFITCFILSIVAANSFYAAVGASGSAFSFSAQFFSVPMRMLLILLTSMAVRALTVKSPAAPMPPMQQNPYYYTQQ